MRTLAYAHAVVAADTTGDDNDWGGTYSNQGARALDMMLRHPGMHDNILRHYYTIGTATATTTTTTTTTLVLLLLLLLLILLLRGTAHAQLILLLPLRTHAERGVTTHDVHDAATHEVGTHDVQED